MVGVYTKNTQEISVLGSHRERTCENSKNVQDIAATVVPQLACVMEYSMMEMKLEK